MTQQDSFQCDLDKGPETKVEEEHEYHWIAYCRKCKVLMTWSKEHIMPFDVRSGAIYNLMRTDLVRIADRVYGHGNYRVDVVQRHIRDHMHIHARPYKISEKYEEYLHTKKGGENESYKI